MLCKVAHCTGHILHAQLEVTTFTVFTMRYRQLHVQYLQLRIQSKQSTQCFISHCPPTVQAQWMAGNPNDIVN